MLDQMEIITLIGVMWWETFWKGNKCGVILVVSWENLQKIRMKNILIC